MKKFLAAKDKVCLELDSYDGARYIVIKLMFGMPEWSFSTSGLRGAMAPGPKPGASGPPGYLLGNFQMDPLNASLRVLILMGPPTIGP